MADRKDPFRGYNFRIEIDGVARNGFKQCHGLDATTRVVEYREGTEKTFTPRKLAGINRYSNIVLKNGITDDASLWDWHKKNIEGKTERKNGSIVLMDEAGEEKLRWNLVNAWPTRWEGPAFDAQEDQIALETIEIAHEGVTKA